MSNPVPHVDPDLNGLPSELGNDDTTPVVMLNLNRYRDIADYGDGRDEQVSGREAYMRYGLVAFAALGNVGARILWSTDAHEVVIGCEHDRYDEVIAVWYPSRAAFLRLAEHPGYLEALAHRTAALEQATLIACAASPTPELSTPFAGS
ncbi:MAG TPA: DUF1330 domain-containing protein [Acidimicrobiia bacterium]